MSLRSLSLRKMTAAVGFGCLLASHASAQNAVVQEAVTYLTVECEDPENGEVTEPVGSGYVFKKTGYILTAFHVVSCIDPKTKKRLQRKSVSARLGSTEAVPAYKVQVEKFNEQDDVAVLRILGAPKSFDRLNTCALRDVTPGTSFLAAGYPEGEDYQPVDGRVGSVDAKGLWSAAAPFARGMSGGPVVVDNAVVGLVKGGLQGVDAARKVIPIQRAASLMQEAAGLFLDNCGKSARTVEYHVKVCNRTKGDLRIAFVDFDRTDQQWMTRAYYPLSPEQCVDPIFNEPGLAFYVGALTKKSQRDRMASIAFRGYSDVVEYCIDKGGMDAPIKPPPCSDGALSMTFYKYIQPKSDTTIDIR